MPDLKPKQGDQEEVAASAQEASSEQDILVLIEKAKADAIQEAEGRATRLAQSMIDKKIARERQTTQTLLSRYQKALAEHGAGAETLEELEEQTKQEMAIQELREKARLYDELQAQTEAERAREEIVRKTCEVLGIDPYDPRIKRDAASPEEFLASAVQVFQEQAGGQAQDQKRQQLRRLKAGGALDVLGGGPSLTPPSWTTGDLDILSSDPGITRTLLRYMGTLTQEEMGRLLSKTKELLKNNPNLSPEEAARMVAQKELGRL